MLHSSQEPWHLILQGKFCEISNRFVDTTYAHSWICCDQVHDLWFSLKLSLLNPTTSMGSILALTMNECSSEMMNNFWAICDSLKRPRGASHYVANSHGNQALGYNKQYYFLDLVCHNVKDFVPNPRSKSYEEGKVPSLSYP